MNRGRFESAPPPEIGIQTRQRISARRASFGDTSWPTRKVGSQDSIPRGNSPATPPPAAQLQIGLSTRLKIFFHAFATQRHGGFASRQNSHRAMIAATRSAASSEIYV